MGLLLWTGEKLTKHNCKNTKKCTTVLVWSFPKASVIVFSVEAVYCIVFSEVEVFNTSVQAVDEKQDHRLPSCGLRSENEARILYNIGKRLYFAV